jgi:hypothetical protein
MKIDKGQCPRCKSEEVSEGTAGTLRCDDCDYSWLPYNTAPRFSDAGLPKSTARSSTTGVLVLLLVLAAIAAILTGLVSPLLALGIAALGLLGIIALRVAK